MEDYAMIVILFLGGGEIEIGDGNPAGMAGCQVVKCLTDDGVIVHLDLMAVFEDQCSGRLRRFGS